MVASVWGVVVAEGDHVSEGDTLVILESMKMEIPVLAESSGVVAKLHIATGDVVQEDDLIAEINEKLRGNPQGDQLNPFLSTWSAVKVHTAFNLLDCRVSSVEHALQET